MRVIVACEKYGTRYLCASTDDEWAKSSLRLLKERYDCGYYSSKEDLDIIQLIKEENIDFHTTKGGKKLFPKCWGILASRSEYEYESVSLEEVEENDD